MEQLAMDYNHIRLSKANHSTNLCSFGVEIVCSVVRVAMDPSITKETVEPLCLRQWLTFTIAVSIKGNFKIF